MKSTSYLVLAVLCLASCGTPGAPRPPSLRLPQPASDLAAHRQGSTVTLTWTEPQRTTDRENIRALGPTLICMGVNDFPMTHCNQVVADLSQPQYASCAPKIGGPVRCAVTLPFEIQHQNPLDQATFAVEIQNTNGRSAGLSNQVRVPTAPAIAPPNDLTATVRQDTVDIVATGIEPFLPDSLSVSFHLFRQQNGGPEVDLGPAAEVSGCGPQSLPPRPFESTCAYSRTFSDRSFEWEKSYEYRVVAITAVAGKPSETVMGDPSAPLKVFTRDVFSPAVPNSVQAVASGVGQPPFIDLTWAPNMESDLAGYNVYRHEQGQAAVKINSEPVKAPSYRDSNVEREHKYFYSVTAIDLRANESAKSVETSEAVPEDRK